MVSVRIVSSVKFLDIVLRRYTYSVLCDYIPQSLSLPLKTYLDIQDPDPLKENQVSGDKRKLDDSGEIESYYDPAAKQRV